MENSIHLNHIREENLEKNYLQTARYLSVARLMVRNVVHDIRIFFRGYLNIIIALAAFFIEYLFTIYRGIARRTVRTEP